MTAVGHPNFRAIFRWLKSVGDGLHSVKTDFRHLSFGCHGENDNILSNPN